LKRSWLVFAVHGANSRSASSLIVFGFIAQTCVEATVRFAAAFGYEVTVVKDATADDSDEEMHAALDINLANYASAAVYRCGEGAGAGGLFR
jgi:nicotinamidase-related amidase